MWGTGRRAGEANVTEGLGVDPPPPPTRGGWVGGRVVATRLGDTGDKTVSGDKTAPGDKRRCALRMPKGRAASTAAVAIDGADSKGKANDNEVRGDAAAVAQRRGAEAAAAARI